MHLEVKKSADAGDVKDLKYIFVDSLDVDPTFEEYLDDYNYCVDKKLFERHEELTPFTERKADWNDNYWEKIKRDLLKNFSRERLDHMRKVARVVNAEKVARLQKERQAVSQPVKPKVSQPAVTQRPVTSPQPRTEPKSKAQQQKEEVEAAKQQLAQENARVERQQREVERQRQESSRRQMEDDLSKKSSGIAPLIKAVTAAVAAAIIYNLLK